MKVQAPREPAKSAAEYITARFLDKADLLAEASAQAQAGGLLDRFRGGPIMSSVNEAQLIQKIDALWRRTASPDAPEAVLGIGDDAAVLDIEPREQVVVSVDDQVEGVHFLRHVVAWPDVGWRAAASALSDLAAMGARPLGALLALQVPSDVDEQALLSCAHGFCRLLSQVGCPLVGGNVSRSEKGLALSVTVLGAVTRGEAFRRDGAHTGDLLLVTGTPGAARAGMRLLGADGGERPRVPRSLPAHAAARERFLSPRPRINEALWLRDRGGVSAVIDISDGLALDTSRLAAASGLAADLQRQHLGALAANPLLTASAAVLEESALDLALEGGEDYELLVAAAPVAVPALLAEFEAAFGLELREVGRLSEGCGVWMLDDHGARQELDVSQRGHDHLRRREDGEGTAAGTEAGTGDSAPQAPRTHAPSRVMVTLALPWFFYGTLRDPESVRDQLCPGCQEEGQAWTPAILGKLPEGYVAMTEGWGTGPGVSGSLFSLSADDRSGAVKRLDRYEGAEYRRVVRPVRETTSGRWQLALCYVLSPGSSSILVAGSVSLPEA